MRALAEKVLGIGTVESRSRKPRVTEAAAQTTEVEPGDTIHTGVSVKRRKRKPKATEPAGDADHGGRSATPREENPQMHPAPGPRPKASELPEAAA
jgi:hypothetical protein